MSRRSVLLPALLALALGCGPATPPPAAPASAPAVADRDPVEQRCDDVLAALKAEEYDRVVTLFDETMKRELPAAKLRAVWHDRLVSTHGGLRAWKLVERGPHADRQRCVLDLDFEQGRLRALVYVAANQEVTGLRFVPVPDGRPAAPAAHPGRRFVGEWRGALKTPMATLRLLLKIAAAPDGGLTATLVSIDQGGGAVPASRVAPAGDRLEVEVKSIAGGFDGTLQTVDGRPALVGTWSQSGAQLPLTLTRAKHHEPLPGARRPQEPKKPYPYREEEVTFESAKAGARFAATLTLPPGPGPFPAVLLITGSGPQDRDETVFGHRPFLILADYLTRRGVAVLRADDRGVGGSTGDRTRATTADFVDDALAGVQYLKTRKEIDRRRIGLIGHSEGGVIAPMAAVRSKDVAFVVMLAGTGLPGEQVLYSQGRRILEAAGAPRAAIAQQRAVQECAFAIVKQEPDNAAAERRIHERCASGAGAPGKEQTAALVKGVTSPWMRYFLTFDPRPTLRQVRVPVLVLNGEKDTQVTVAENVPEVEAALRKGGNRHVTVRVLPGLNHLFQACRTGGPTEYAQIEETMSPTALQVIGDWVAKQAGPRR